VVGLTPHPLVGLAEGYAWFDAGRGDREALALLYAAGVAWDRAAGEAVYSGPGGDLALLRRYTSSRKGAVVVERAASALLQQLSSVHTRLTRALCERDLGPADIEALCRGESLPDSE
jgi:hypothetical protein